MAKTIELQVQARDRGGKGAARAVRRAGLVPGVIYGDKQEPTTISMEYMPVWKLVETGRIMATLLDIKVGDKTERAIARDVQFHPVKDTLLHVDFLRLGKGAKIAVEVPVNFINEEESVGLSRGGVLNVVRHTVEVLCPATDIPDSFDLDLAGLDIGDGMHASSVTLPEGITFTITDRDFTIATVAAPTVIAEVEDGEEATEAGDVPTVGDEEAGEDGDAGDATEDKE